MRIQKFPLRVKPPDPHLKGRPRLMRPGKGASNAVREWKGRGGGGNGGIRPPPKKKTIPGSATDTIKVSGVSTF